MRPAKRASTFTHELVGMWYLVAKAALSGVLIAVVSEVAKRYSGFGALIASLPLVSVLGMIWLWHDRPDRENMAAHAIATIWCVLPSLPMFAVIAVLLRNGASFHIALCREALSNAVWSRPRLGFHL